MGLNYLFIAQVAVIYSIYVTIFTTIAWFRTPKYRRKYFWGDGDIFATPLFDCLLYGCPALIITLVLLSKYGIIQ